MALNTFSPAIAPDVGSNRGNSFRILRSEFGDGYIQRTGDGINTKQAKVTLNWTDLSIAEAEDIMDFLDARGGYEAFNYTLPDASSATKFVCEQYSMTWSEGALRSVTAEFEKVYDL